MEKLTIAEIKATYPDEWVLVGNPTIERAKVLGGVVLFHSKDKREVCYLGKSSADGYDKITLTYTGTTTSLRKVGIMKRV